MAVTPKLTRGHTVLVEQDGENGENGAIRDATTFLITVTVQDPRDRK